MPDPRIFISAGEASGERYGAMLIEAVRVRLPKAKFFGLGGAAMESAGCERIARAEDLAVMGITEVLLHLPRIYGEYRRLVRSIQAQRPDAAVLIDFPDVNFRLARELKKLGIPVVYFVSPQLWAWKKRRIRWVRDRVTKMLVIFPFEERYYRERGVDAEFVGHPLAELPLPEISRQDMAHQYGLDASKSWIGLLPGSRAREVCLHLPTMAAAANRLGRNYEYLLPSAATLNPAWVRAMVAKVADAQPGSNVSVRVVEDARAVLSHARVSIVASGTATVEAALIGNPFIAVYRLSPVSYSILSRIVRVPHVAMANLIAGDRIVPELLQADFTPDNVVQAVRPLIEDGPARARMMEALARVRVALQVPHPPDQESDAQESRSQSSIDRVADWVLRFANYPEFRTETMVGTR